MSDYLTRLVERSLGLAPRIEPLIAPLHAPADQALSESEAGPVRRSRVQAIDASSDQELSERAETLAGLEPEDPVATIRVSQQNAPPVVAVNARSFESPPSRPEPESQPSRPSSSTPAPEADSPIQTKDDRADSARSRPEAPAPQTPSTPRVEILETIPASSSPALAKSTRIVSHEPVHSPVQTEITSPLKPAASPVVPPVESAPPLLPRATTTAPEKTTRIIVQPDLISPLEPAESPPATRALPATQPLFAPSMTTTAPKRTPDVVAQSERISFVKPAVSPFDRLGDVPHEPSAVHITIGRIEVRAVLPPTATPKVAPPAAPGLSLEEYLKQRNGRSA